MKNNIWTIMKKEFSRFIQDRRVLVMLILPGIMIYIVYSFMGAALQSMLTPDAEYVSKTYIANMPVSLKEGGIGGWEWAQLIPIGTEDMPDADAAKEKITVKEADLCVVFPADFERQVEAYNIQTSTGPAPNIEIYYNSSDVKSQLAYETVTALLNAYESSLANKFDINRDIADMDLATEKDRTATMISSLLPMLLMLFLYSGCVGVAPESIAGEKERGTIGALLVSPLKRSQLAIGKILSLGVLAFLAGLVSTIATILSLPKLTGMNESINVNIYEAKDYFFLALIILSTILLLITLISIISAFSKTVKEANAAVMPMMIIIMLIGVTGMFGGGAQTKSLYYIIPFYNSVQSMSGIFSLEYSAVNITLTTLSNLAFACAGGFVLTRMFNSEKVMFAR